MLAEVRAPGARAVVVNMWATWCVPCREEFPDLMRLRRTYGSEGLRLILVSTDFPDQTEPARRFLASQGVDFGSFIKQGDDASFIDGISPEWSGAVPATFIYDSRGELRRVRENRTTFEALENDIRPLLKGAAPTAKETSR